MKKNKLFNWFLIIFILLLIVILFIYYYFSKEYGFGIPCIFYKLTNLYCPGCGITRLLFSLINLDFYQAFRYNPLVFILIPFLGYIFIDYIVKSFRYKNNYFYKKINNRTWIVLIIIVLLFGVLRNISGFEFLKPTDIM